MKWLSFVLSISCYAQTLPIPAPGVNGSRGCGSPVLTNMAVWYSADCMTAISPCATSYANNHAFTAGDTWKDRSVNANNLTLDASQPSCVFKTSQINSLPAVSFNTDGGGNCGWIMTTAADPTASTWAAFVVFQGTTNSKGTFLGAFTNVVSPGTFKYFTAASSKEQGLDKDGVAQVALGNAAWDTNWHQMNLYFSNVFQENTTQFRIDRTSDGTSTPGLLINSGGILEIGIEKENSTYREALKGRIAELILYVGVTAILSAGDITSNETYLNCRYGL